MSRRQKRYQFVQWLRQRIGWNTDGQTGVSASGLLQRSIQLEQLETRTLMAGDVLAPYLGSAYTTEPLMGWSTAGLRAEGEAAPDLVQFAKAIKDSGAIMYGAYWCQHCLSQKELFQDGGKYLPYVEVTGPDRQPNSVAIDNNITSYPTWVFLDGSRLVGEQSLATLAAKIGVAIPQSSTPSIAEIANVNVEQLSPLHVPVDAYDPNGNPLTFTVSSSNPNVISAEMMPAADRSLRIRVAGFGEMVFKLFETEVPVPVQKVAELATSGYYNNTKIHRVVNEFMIQMGIGATQVSTIDDQFNVNLQHNRSGVLAYAKTSADDSGTSQFYITEVPTRFLDFNHPVFGQLVEGEAVREAISNVATVSTPAPNDEESTPTVDIIIESVTVFTDTENGLIRLKSLASSGSSTITVTATDTEGNSTSRSFTATATAHVGNGAPFLNPIAPVTAPANTPTTITLTAQDVENDPVVYSVAKVGSGDFNVSVNSTTGVVTFTPGAGFTGTAQFRATVQQTVPSSTSSATDSQLVTVNVVGTNAPTGVDLDAASDLGASNSDNITSATAPTFTVSGTTAGALVRLKVGNTVIGEATATGSTTVVTANSIASVGQGAILVTATQTVSGAESAASPALSMTFDTVAPVDVSPSLFPSSVIVAQAFSLNLTHAEEGQGLVYALENAPSGMTIDASTGVISWTPTQAQLGARTFNLRLTDVAGNTKTQAVTLNVIDEPLAKIILEVVDMQGNPITQVSTGTQFRVRFLTQDMRGLQATGVFGSYIDLLYDPAVVAPIATDAIAYAPPFENGRSPTASTPTVPGQINELGAFGGLTRSDGDPKLIATVTFTALAAGNANIRSEAADLTGSEILLFDRSAAVPPSQVDYGAATLVVGANFQVVNDTYNFDEDTGPHVLNVLANDTITGVGELTIISVSSPSASGTVTVAADGKSLSYTPGLNFNGAETFTYTVRNESNVTLTGTVTIQVADVNDPPLANNDVFDVIVGSSNNVLNVLLNDSTGVDAPASETLRVQSVSTATQGGTASVNASGLNILYTPASGFVGTDTLTYVLSDGRGGTATATVSINVKLANPPPGAVSDAFTVVEDAEEASFDVLANDTKEPGETLTITAVSASTRGSTFRVSTDGQRVLYKPGLNINGTEVLTYTVRDDGGATAVGTVTFTITAVNDAPVAVDDQRNVFASAGNTTLDVLVNDTDPDTGDVLTITAITQPLSGQGSVAISSDAKSLIYTPPSSSFTGTVVFTYTVSDGTLTDSASVTLNVQNFAVRTLGGSLLSTNGSVPSALGGVDLQLVGVDINGQSQSYSISTDRHGSFQQANMAPGTYTISRPALPFLEDSGHSMTITSAATDTSNTSLNSAIGGLRSQYISIRDFLGSSSINTLTVAVTPGNGESWFAIRNGMSGYSNIQARLDAAATTLTVSATNPSNQNVQATLPLAGANSRVSVLATSGDARLLRVTGTPESLGFTAVNAPAGNGEGEGGSEFAALSMPTSRMSTSGLVAEGEAAPEIQPPTGRMLTPSQALRQALGSQALGAQASGSAVVADSQSSLITATTQLPAGAVDSALSEIDTSAADSLLDALSQNYDTLGNIDTAIASL